jgi:hypothetical protein
VFGVFVEGCVRLEESVYDDDDTSDLDSGIVYMQGMMKKLVGKWAE